MIHNKRLDSTVTEWFIRGRKLNIYLAFITQSYFKLPKDVRLNFFIVKTPNRKQLPEKARNHSYNIKAEDFINIYK